MTLWGDQIWNRKSSQIFKNATFQISNFISVSWVIKHVPIWYNVKFYLPTYENTSVQYDWFFRCKKNFFSRNILLILFRTKIVGTRYVRTVSSTCSPTCPPARSLILSLIYSLTHLDTVNKCLFVISFSLYFKDAYGNGWYLNLDGVDCLKNKAKRLTIISWQTCFSDDLSRWHSSLEDRTLTICWI